MNARQNIFFSGDSGYDIHFKEIGNKYGPFDLAMLPIGSYRPEWFMLPVHLNPRQAVQAHVNLNARRSLGIHWGTFILSDEPIQEPPHLFIESARQAGLADNEVIVLQHGQTLVLP